MTAAIHAILEGMPQVTDLVGFKTEPSTGGAELVAPMTPYPAPMRAPSLNANLPDPAIGGYAEVAAPDGRTVDPGFSPYGVPGSFYAQASHVSFMAQGHYDAVPSWNSEIATGEGQVNRHGARLRQGILTQLSGYNPPEAVSALGYVAALSSTRSPAEIKGGVS